ncbi:MAG TPA: glycosyltransferase, partial [Anaerolineae bacterium]|nr:glycosyltransferase [Anaerolineae bacterium]
MKVSLIVTVLNEARSLSTLLDSIAAQTRQPDEVVICDGGSTDGTPDLLRAETRFPLRVIERPGSNISQGRNTAIEAATGEVIVSTDAGVRLDPRWLQKLVEPFAAASTSVVAGFFLPDAHTPFEIAMSATVLPQLNEIDPVKFLPSSRSVAFTKAAWQVVGGYPEWLDYCEDLIFDFALRDKFGAFAFAPEALAYFKPRSSLKSFFKQYYRYARGDGKANLWLKRHHIRSATYLIALPSITWLTATINPWCALLYA